MQNETTDLKPSGTRGVKTYGYCLTGHHDRCPAEPKLGWYSKTACDCTCHEGE